MLGQNATYTCRFGKMVTDWSERWHNGTQATTAARLLATQGIDARVIDVYRPKPLNREVATFQPRWIPVANQRRPVARGGLGPEAACGQRRPVARGGLWPEAACGRKL